MAVLPPGSTLGTLLIIPALLNPRLGEGIAFSTVAPSPKVNRASRSLFASNEFTNVLAASLTADH